MYNVHSLPQIPLANKNHQYKQSTARVFKQKRHKFATLQSTDAMLSTRIPNFSETSSPQPESPKGNRGLNSIETLVSKPAPISDYLMNVNFSSVAEQSSRNLVSNNSGPLKKSSMNQMYNGAVPAIRVAHPNVVSSGLPPALHLNIPEGPPPQKQTGVGECSIKTLPSYVKLHQRDASIASNYLATQVAHQNTDVTPRRSAFKRREFSNSRAVLSSLNSEFDFSLTSDEGLEATSKQSKKTIFQPQRKNTKESVSLFQKEPMVCQIFRQLSASDHYIRLKIKERIWSRVQGVINQIPLMRKNLTKTVSKLFPRVNELIVRKWWKLLVSFLCKEKELAFHLLQKIQDFCGELDFMKKALRVGDLNSAIDYLNKMRDVAVELGRQEEELRIYQEMGMTYQRLGQHQNAIKCFKKQLELAWLKDDTYWEMAAYDNLGLQNYYLGDVGAARYYHDRMIRGKSQNQSSIIRKLSKDNSQNKYEKRKQQSVKPTPQCHEESKELLVRTISSPQAPKTNTSEQIFSSKVRPCTPINNIDMADLPSPRGRGKGDNKMYNLLPFYQEQVAANKTSKSKKSEQLANKYDLNRAELLAKRNADQCVYFFKLFGIAKKRENQERGKSRLMSKQKRYEERLKPEYIKNLPSNNTKELLRRAKQSQSNNREVFVSYNHLSPNRNAKNFKDVEEKIFFNTFEKLMLLLREILNHEHPIFLKHITAPIIAARTPKVGF